MKVSHVRYINMLCTIVLFLIVLLCFQIHSFLFSLSPQNLVFVTTSFIAWLIPDRPVSLANQVRREAYLANEIILKTELHRARGESSKLTEGELRAIHKMERAMSVPENLDVIDSGSPPIVDVEQPRLRKLNEYSAECKL